MSWRGMGWTGTTIARVTAGCLGAFTALNIVGAFRAGLDANLWWVDLRGLPAGPRTALLALAAAALVAFALRPALSGWRRTATAGLLGLLIAACLRNAWTVVSLFRAGLVEPGLPVPFSLATAALLTLVLVAVLHPHQGPTPRLRAALLALTAAGALAVLFPLGQMFAFGRSDYRRPADTVVVFGSRVFADGRLSDALADRMRTAVELVLDGQADTLIVSGGPGDGDVHETSAMRAFAEQAGVAPQAIIEDPTGWNTQATVQATVPLLAGQRALVVSHAYHLPRIKLAYQRRGLEVYTVPARESYLLSRMPWFMAREVAAFWVYWGRSILV